jgi:hypothetical protein
MKMSTILVSYSYTYIYLLLQCYYNQYPIQILISTNNTCHKIIVLLLLHRLVANYLSIHEIDERV